MSLSLIRANQKSALGLSGGLFSGAVAIKAVIADISSLKFFAQITFQTGDTNAPSKVFTACNDDGLIRKFSDLDDIVKWVNGAFTDVSSIAIVLEDAQLIAKPFIAPSDPVAYGLKQKAAFAKLLAGISDNKMKADAAVTTAEGYGWDLPNANPALQANYAALVANADAVTAIQTYYQSQVTFYTV